MKVYRLCKSKYASDLSGSGAAKAGGRWNSRGVAVIYTAESRALCLSELFVHLPAGIIPEDFTICTFEIPEKLIIDLPKDILKKAWNQFPYNTISCMAGDRFVAEAESPALRVPSAIVPQEYNYILNPEHPEFKSIKLLKKEKFNFDLRLFK